MKFLCVPCDEAMMLSETRGPDDGSMTVVFGCPRCGREVAMLTNAMETQVVRSLGIKIGGRNEPAAPMEMLRTSLTGQREGLFSEEAGASSPEQAPAAGSGSKCPFTGTVAAAFEERARADGVPVWSPEAEERIARIPSFARPMVRQGVEQYAREQGYMEINGTVMDEVKGRFGM